MVDQRRNVKNISGGKPEKRLKTTILKLFKKNRKKTTKNYRFLLMLGSSCLCRGVSLKIFQRGKCLKTCFAGMNVRFGHLI